MILCSDMIWDFLRNFMFAEWTTTSFGLGIAFAATIFSVGWNVSTERIFEVKLKLYSLVTKFSVIINVVPI